MRALAAPLTLQAARGLSFLAVLAAVSGKERSVNSVLTTAGLSDGTSSRPAHPARPAPPPSPRSARTHTPPTALPKLFSIPGDSGCQTRSAAAAAAAPDSLRQSCRCDLPPAPCALACAGLCARLERWRGWGDGGGDAICRSSPHPRGGPQLPGARSPVPSFPGCTN